MAGEITTSAYVDIPSIARETICDIGYDRESFGYDGHTCGVMVAIDEQSPDIAQGVDDSEEVRSGSAGEDDQLDKQGAGDQGMMFGYACDETDVLMPLPIHLAHRMAERLAEVRKAGHRPVPAARRQDPGHLRVRGRQARSRSRRCSISTQHNDGVDRDTEIRPDLIEHVIRPVIPAQFADDDFEVFVNPTGRFVIGGPVGDAGLTGRKIIVDTYGGAARHGGGAFSGKDPSKVDRSAAYAARWVAKNVVAAGAATRCEVQVAYAIGVAHPVSILVETFGTNTVDPAKLDAAVREVFDLRPGRDRRATSSCAGPIFRETAAYGHFGRTGDGFTWERTDRVDALRVAPRPLRPVRRAARARPVVRVLPDVPAIDRAFDYLVPDALGDQVRVGTMVRVPLHGRRVAGWVVERRRPRRRPGREAGAHRPRWSGIGPDAGA